MRITLLVLLSVFLFDCQSIMAVAQDLQSFIPKIEKAFKDEVPQYKLVRKELNDKGKRKGKGSIHQWGTQTEGVSLTVFYGDSPEEAAQMIKNSMNHISVGPDRKLNGLGDEAFLWIAPKHGYGTIQFRKGKVYVTLSATTVDMAERLARRIADLITPNE